MTRPAATQLNVRRNTLILVATMAVYSAVLQLVAAVSSITFGQRTRSATSSTSSVPAG